MTRRALAVTCLIVLVLTAWWLFREWAPAPQGKATKVPASQPAPMVPVLGLRG
jgi:hypothetical protein